MLERLRAHTSVACVARDAGQDGVGGQSREQSCRLPQHNHLCLFAWAGPNRTAPHRTDPADGDAIFLLLEHVCILILKRAHTWNSSCGRECWSCAGSELRVDGAESDTSHKFLLFSRAACPCLSLPLPLPLPLCMASSSSYCVDNLP